MQETGLIWTHSRVRHDLFMTYSATYERACKRQGRTCHVGLRWVGSFKLQDSFAAYSLFYRALLPKETYSATYERALKRQGRTWQKQRAKKKWQWSPPPTSMAMKPLRFYLCSRSAFFFLSFFLFVPSFLSLSLFLSLFRACVGPSFEDNCVPTERDLCIHRKRPVSCIHPQKETCVSYNTCTSLLQQTTVKRSIYDVCGNTLQHNVTHCNNNNTLQHTATLSMTCVTGASSVFDFQKGSCLFLQIYRSLLK